MTSELQHIAIAEACGWDYVETINGIPYGIPPVEPRNNPLPLPDYLSDLNASHEMEEKLTFEQRYKYVSLLLINRSGNMRDDLGEDVFPALHATAAQRAEAFLRTLNLWTDAQ